MTDGFSGHCCLSVSDYSRPSFGAKTSPDSNHFTYHYVAQDEAQLRDQRNDAPDGRWQRRRRRVIWSSFAAVRLSYEIDSLISRWNFDVD